MLNVLAEMVIWTKQIKEKCRFLRYDVNDPETRALMLTSKIACSEADSMQASFESLEDFDIETFEAVDNASCMQKFAGADAEELTDGSHRGARSPRARTTASRPTGRTRS